MGYEASAERVDFSYQRLRVHPNAGALSHWQFQGNGTDSVGSNNLTGNPIYQRVNGFDLGSDLKTLSTRSNLNLAAPTNNPDIKSINAITVAAWVSIAQNPSGNLAICGMRGPGPGAPYNFPWELGYEAGVGVRWFWQSGTKTYEGTASIAIPFQQWVHLIGTRNAAQDTARLYVNGALVSEATGLTAFAGGANQNSARFFNNDLDVTLNGQIFSCIVLNQYTDVVPAQALYESTIDTVAN